MTLSMVLYFTEREGIYRSATVPYPCFSCADVAIRMCVVVGAVRGFARPFKSLLSYDSRTADARRPSTSPKVRGLPCRR